MNPATAQPTAPRPFTDIGRPQPAAPLHPAPTTATPQVPAALAPLAQVPAPSASTLTTNIVSNIPMHTPAPLAAKAPGEDDELDKIMQDVGHELKQADRKTPKKKLFSRRHKAKPIAAASRPAPAPSAPAPMPAPQPAAVLPAKTPATQAAPKSTAPIGVFFVTIIITGALIAAAFYSYK